MKANFDDLGDYDKILVFFKKLLKEWQGELDARPEAERRTIKGRKDAATYKQCARYLEPLFNLCRKKVRVSCGLRGSCRAATSMIRHDGYLA